MKEKKIPSCLLLSVFLITAVASFGNSGKITEGHQPGLDQELLLDNFNEFRKQGAHCGLQYHESLPPFTWSDQLASVAQLYSDALYKNRNNPAFARRGGFDLQGALKGAAYDYVNLYQSHASLTQSFTEEAYTAWLMGNEGACNHVMDAGYTEIGVAKTDLFWVMLLAAPKIPHYWNADSINIQLVVEETNKYRSMGTRCGNQYFPPVEPVVWNTQLAEAAQLHSDDMSENQFFDHTGTGGSTLASRVDKVGYRFRTIGENIAMGETQTEVIVVEGWMNSPGHCRNIMNGSFTEMGVARSGIYWTQVFGRPQPE